MLAAMAWQCISCIIYGVGCGYLATEITVLYLQVAALYNWNYCLR